MKRADELATMFADDDMVLEDKKVFVKNLGWLLSQTRNGVKGCELVDEDTVVIKFCKGAERYVNIACNSYSAIIRDVAKQI